MSKPLDDNADAKDLVGIVTVLFNSDEVLSDFFSSLARQKNVNFRLYVVDNSKTDSGSRLCRELADLSGINSSIIFNDANYGVAKGNNQGIEMAVKDGCTHILLANNDTYFSDPFLLLKLLEALHSNNVDLVTPKIKYFGTNRIWCAGGDMLQWRGTNRHFGDGEEDIGQHNESRVITYAPTCFMLFPIRILTESAPMDERYFVYYDDTDFVWKNINAGRKLYYIASAELFHKVSYSTGGDETPFSIYYMSRNRVYFILKNLPLHKKLFALIFLLLTRPFRYTKNIKIVANATIDGFKLYFAASNISKIAVGSKSKCY